MTQFGRPFRRFFWGQAVSSLGDWTVPVALPFALINAGGGAGQVGLVLAAASAPYLAFVIASGVWADRLPRRRVMYAADLTRAVAQIGTAVLLIASEDKLWALMSLQAIYGTGHAFFDPASVGIVPEIVPRAQLQRANALMGLQRNGAAVLGPAVGGILVATGGGSLGLLLDAASFLVNAVSLVGLPISPSVRQRESFAVGLREGWLAFKSRPWLWGSVAHFSVLVGLVLRPLQVYGPVIARTHLSGAKSWAVISAAQGVGGILGGLLGMRLPIRHPLRVGFFLLLLSWPLFGLSLAHSRSTLVVAAGAAVAFGSLALFMALWNTALQSGVPSGLLSRVAAYDTLGSTAAAPLGLALAGPMVVAFGATGAVDAGTGWVIVSTVVVLMVNPVRNFTNAPLPNHAVSSEGTDAPGEHSPDQRSSEATTEGGEGWRGIIRKTS